MAAALQGSCQSPIAGFAELDGGQLTLRGLVGMPDGSRVLADTVSDSIESVQRGQPLARSLETCRLLFPASVIEMISVAEESGRLDQELVRLAGAYEEELDRHLKMMVTLVEPALLFLMAVLVGTVVIGMLLPIFNLQELIR